MISVKLVAALMLVYGVQVQCGDVAERTCGALFSQENFAGNSFPLNDFDQSANLKRDYRPTREGWRDTKSIKVENGCTVTLCSESYFMGNCQSYTSEEASQSKLPTTVASVNCTCERTCRCEDLFITEEDRERGYIGRVYFNEGCDICDSYYMELHNGEHAMLKDIARHYPVEAVILYSGCSVTFFAGFNFQGDKLAVIEAPMFQGRFGVIGSYNATCKELDTSENRPSKFETYHPSVDLTDNSKSLDEILRSDKTLANHPGVKAMLTSAQANRSSRRAYILSIGPISPEWTGFFRLKDPLISDDGYFGEHSVPVGVDNLRIVSELRIIGTEPSQYSEYAKELDMYLSRHEDLNSSIPNVVIVSSYLVDSIFAEQTLFQETLNGLKQLRHRLFDDNYSNVIFELGGLHELWPEHPQWQLEERIAEYEQVIRSKLDFLNPITFSISSDEQMGNLKHVNGYLKLENGEYWPRNLETGLVNICEKSGDPLGQSIIKAYFQETFPQRSKTSPVHIPVNRQSDNLFWIFLSTHPTQGWHGDTSDERFREHIAIGNVGYQPHYENEDHTGWPTIDGDCGCEAMRMQLNQRVDELESELALERTERLADADRITAAIWEKFKFKWKMHFEL